MKRYLLNVTFYAGSTYEEDIDRGLFLLDVEDKEFSKSELIEVFEEVNRLLNYYDYDEIDAKGTNFPISYGMGLNIYTLMDGVEIYTEGKVIEVCDECGKSTDIDNYYEIKIWE